ncbi:MAG: hypothetical protein QXO21_05755, partial [Candidatus Anstonellales archaeon]
MVKKKIGILLFMVLVCTFKENVFAAAKLNISVGKSNYAYKPKADTEWVGSFGFNLTTTGTTNITSIKLTFTGSESTTNITRVRLYKDDDNFFAGASDTAKPYGRPAIDSGESLTGDSGANNSCVSWSAGTITLSTGNGCLTAFTVNVVSPTTIYIHVALDIATGATLGNTVGVQIAANADVVNSANLAVNTTAPYSLGNATLKTSAVYHSKYSTDNIYASIQEAIDRTGTLSSATYIEVQDSATYAEAITINSTKVSGTSSTNTFTLKGQANLWPLISGNNTVISISGVSYVYFENLKVTNPIGGGALTSDAAFNFTSTSNYGRVKNCIIYDSMQAIYFNSSTNGEVINVTIAAENASYSVSTGLIKFSNSATGGKIQNSIVYVRGQTSGSSETKYAVWVSTDSQTSFSSDYNLFYSGQDNNNWTGVWGTTGYRYMFGATSWNNASTQDANSQGSSDTQSAPDPQFVSLASNDFRLKSTFGTWNPSTSAWDKYDVDSPCIDGGNPADPYSSEPEDNGNRINIGAYGNTSQASLSGVRYASFTGNDDTINTWTGKAGTTSWNTANNWSKKAVPTSTDNVYIPARNYNPTLDVASTINTLTISNYSNNSPAQTNGTLTLNNVSYNLTVNNDFTVESGTTYNHSAGTLYVKGNFSNSGTFNHIGGTVELNGAGNQVITTDGDNFYNLTINNTGGVGTSVSTGTSNINVSNQLTLTSANALD